MVKFRFQDLEVWKLSIEIANELFDVADELDAINYHRFAEQLRASGLSMSNNIAEGSGSEHTNEFKYYLNIARRSTFECANIVIVLNIRELISEEKANYLLEKLDQESRMLTNLKKSL